MSAWSDKLRWQRYKQTARYRYICRHRHKRRYRYMCALLELELLSAAASASACALVLLLYYLSFALLSSLASLPQPQLLWRFKFALLPMSRQPRPLSQPACLGRGSRLSCYDASFGCRQGEQRVEEGTLKLLLRLHCCCAASVLSAPKKAACACLVFVRLVCVCAVCVSVSCECAVCVLCVS